MAGPERNRLSYNRIFQLYGMDFGYMDFFRLLRPVFRGCGGDELPELGRDCLLIAFIHSRIAKIGTAKELHRSASPPTRELILLHVEAMLQPH